MVFFALLLHFTFAYPYQHPPTPGPIRSPPVRIVYNYKHDQHQPKSTRGALHRPVVFAASSTDISCTEVYPLSKFSPQPTPSANLWSRNKHRHTKSSPIAYSELLQKQRVHHRAYCRRESLGFLDQAKRFYHSRVTHKKNIETKAIRSWLQRQREAEYTPFHMPQPYFEKFNLTSRRRVFFSSCLSSQTPGQLHDAMPQNAIANFDWRDSTTLTPIRSQHSPLRLGSCWAFAAASSVSDRIQIQNGTTAKYKYNPQVSVQHLLNCEPAQFYTIGGEVTW